MKKPIGKAFTVEVALESTSVVRASVCVVRIKARVLSTRLVTGGKGRADWRFGHDHGARRAERSLFAHASKHTISRICPISVSNETEIGHLDGRGAPELTPRARHTLKRGGGYDPPPALAH